MKDDCPGCDKVDQEVSKHETRYPGVGLLLTLGSGLLFWGLLYYTVFR
jgi:hypothetical protein